MASPARSSAGSASGSSCSAIILLIALLPLLRSPTSRSYSCQPTLSALDAVTRIVHPATATARAA